MLDFLHSEKPPIGETLQGLNDYHRMWDRSGLSRAMRELADSVQMQELIKIAWPKASRPTFVRIAWRVTPRRFVDERNVQASHVLSKSNPAGFGRR